MEKVCAWCGKDLGEIEGKGQTGTTHGICQECEEKELKKIKDKKRREERRRVSLLPWTW